MTVLQRIVKMIAPGSLYRNLPFVYFLAFLGVIYIALGHYAERNMRKIDHLQDELQEKRWQYMSVHSEVMRQGSRSKMADAVAQAGLFPPHVAPKELIIDSDLPAEDNE
ncbi:MAG TPA: FtsL-like putative cell division protein [Saprospiraceae bacterium]|nr:FtsL-like putative cell division protein [Saprospiraceae bacterium]